MLKTVSTQLALASDTLPEVLAKGNTTGGTDLAVSSGDDITFADSSKAIFGAGSDLEIYSDGTAGLIKVNTVYGLGDITITQSADNKGIAILDSTESGAFYLRHNAANTFISNNDTRDMILATNSFDRLTLDGTTGDATFSGNLVIGTSGNGIDFSATAGTGTSELLDDYEEGVWTPELRFGGATTGIAYATQYGTYTKIGRLITAYGKIALSSKGSATGNAELYGLPVTLPTGGIGVPALAYAFNVTHSGSLNFHAEGTTNRIALQQASDAGSVAYLLDGNFANNSDLEISITYMV
jgi:hypothetical protein